MKTAIIVPVFNEEERLTDLLNLMPRLDATLVIVDDGSDKEVERFIPANLSNPVKVVELSRNYGQGYALDVGIRYALHELKADVFVTLDSDGQHDPSDIRGMVRALTILNQDIFFGSRFHEGRPKGMSLGRFFLLKAATRFERRLTGLNLSDAHNGLRCFNRKTAELMKLKQNRMAHATEFKQIVAKNKLTYGEYSVSLKYGIDKPSQSLWGCFQILFDLAYVSLKGAKDGIFRMG